ncbi:MAG: hypothetical protein JWL90_1226 [Chthoniobacteraceae bacterium]|nr:hypothetical protein [Chthoniobacteraceae bacterium]
MHMPFSMAHQSIHTQTTLHRMKKHSLLDSSRSALALLSIVTAGTMAQLSAQAGPDGKTPLAAVVDEPFGGAIHGLLNLEFSDHYITPRGLDVEHQGLVFQPLLLLFWDLYSPKEGFLNDITLTTGVWNSWHTRKSGATPRQWNEIDPIVGLTFKFATVVTFDVFYTAFNSQTNSYDTSTNLDLKLTLDDSGYLGAFA